MFEKESEENGFGIGCTVNPTVAWQKGAEFGYNETHRWYDIKEKLPPYGETVLLYYGEDALGKSILETGCIDYRENWYSKRDEIPIKWQSINLPK